MIPEKIKNFALANKLMLAVAVFGLVFLLINRIGSCVDKKQGATVEQISEDAVRRHVIDSMQNLTDKELIAQNNRLVKESEQRLKDQQKVTVGYKNEAKIWKHKTDSLMGVYEADPTLQNCDSVVSSQQKAIAEQEGAIESLGAEAEEYSLQLHTLKQNIVLLDSTVLRERNEIKNLQIDLTDTRVLYEKLKDRRKTGNLVRNTIILVELVAILIKK
jgi:hypothetical protein